MGIIKNQWDFYYVDDTSGQKLRLHLYAIFSRKNKDQM